MDNITDTADVCARKHGGVDTSELAYRKASQHENERAREIFSAIRDMGSDGLHSE